MAERHLLDGVNGFRFDSVCFTSPGTVPVVLLGGPVKRTGRFGSA